jgi:hypothetical protein
MKFRVIVKQDGTIVNIDCFHRLGEKVSKEQSTINVLTIQYIQSIIQPEWCVTIENECKNYAFFVNKH